MTPRAHTQAVTIHAPPDAVLEIVGDPRQLPRWAPGFAPSVRAGRAGEWVIKDGEMERHIQVRVSRTFGTVDLLVKAASGCFEPRLYSRVTGSSTASEYVFTLLLAEDLDDAAVAEQQSTVAEELQTLRRLVEGRAVHAVRDVIEKPTSLAYVISHLTPLDAEALARYRTLAAETIAQYGGRYIVRGGPIETLEGDAHDRENVIVVQFPSPERAREWYRSPEYAEALKIRQTALQRRLLLVQGVEQ